MKLFRTKIIFTCVAIFLGYVSCDVAGGNEAFGDSLLDLFRRQEKQVPNLKISFLERHGSRTVREFRADELFTPASVQKIFISNAVLKTLGADYVFKTEFFYNSSEQSLTILPSGDPSLTSDSLINLLRVLEARGVSSLKKVSLLRDEKDSFLAARGIRAYEAGAQPLSFNFNALGMQVCPGVKGRLATVTPYSSLLKKRITNEIRTEAGARDAQVKAEPTADGWVLSGSVAEEVGCFDIYRSTADPKEYLLDELKKLGRAFNVVFATSVIDEVGAIPKESENIFTVQSKPLAELLATMNQQSSNFFAEQFILALGKKESGHFSYAAGVEKMRSLADSGDFASPDTIVDGSGLSRVNRTTARRLLHVFQGLIDDQRYRISFENSLPQYGVSGTLKLRKGDILPCIIRAKTGTLDGVNALVGMVYKDAASTEPLFFVLLQNGSSSLAAGRKFEDTVLLQLCREQ